MNLNDILGVVSAAAGVGSLALQIIDARRRQQGQTPAAEATADSSTDDLGASGDDLPDSDDGSGCPE
ncbi:hypothetical protein [Streptomyces sp. NPDC017964]|uniref:hypothetical protein n=1 Tax=Streptomyces sp. NPDC017964 TaxID=3365022 RepID=UPI00379E7015